MADANMQALALLGKTIRAAVYYSGEPEIALMQARVVGVVLPAPGSQVSLQLLMHSGSGHLATEGYQYEIFWDSILGIQDVGI
jgi:hypothetical protein